MLARNGAPIASVSNPFFGGGADGAVRATAAIAADGGLSLRRSCRDAHELSNDWLGKELIQPRLLQCTLPSNRAQGCTAASHTHSLDRTASRPSIRHYSTKT